MQGASLGMPLPFLCRACIGSRQKNAGGHPPALAGGKPPALGGPSIRGYRYLYSRSYVPGLREALIWLELAAAVVALWLPLALVAQQMVGLVK